MLIKVKKRRLARKVWIHPANCDLTVSKEDSLILNLEDGVNQACTMSQNRVEIEEPGGISLVGGSDENRLEQGAVRSSGLYFIHLC